MIDIKPLITETFEQVKEEFGGMYKELNLYYISPDIGDTIPCITYYELDNKDYARVLGNEYAEITIQFTIFGQHPHYLFKSVAVLDEVMCNKLGFDKIYTGPPIMNGEIYTEEIRFSAIVNQNYEIFK